MWKKSYNCLWDYDHIGDRGISNKQMLGIQWYWSVKVQCMLKIDGTKRCCFEHLWVKFPGRVIMMYTRWFEVRTLGRLYRVTGKRPFGVKYWWIQRPLCRIWFRPNFQYNFEIVGKNNNQRESYDPIQRRSQFPMLIVNLLHKFSDLWSLD